VREDGLVGVSQMGAHGAVDPLDRRRFLAKLVFVAIVVAIAGAFAFSVAASRAMTGSWWASGASQDLGFTLTFVAFPLVGVVLSVKRPENALGWVMLSIGVILAFNAVIGAYATYALHGGPGGTEVAAALEAITQALWLPILGIPSTYLLLLFPTGHLPSPRWRWFAWLLGISFVVAYLAITLSPGPMTESSLPTTTNPLGIEALKPLLAAATASLVMLPIGIVAAIVSLIRRYRHADEVTRAQLRWVVLATSIVGALYAVVLVLSFNTDWGGASTPAWLAFLQNVALFSFALIPISIAIAVLRYHLFDIDLVINRAVVIAALVIFITIVYVGIVVGIGSIVGSRTSPLLSALAAAVVAIAFQPARGRAHRLADRIVYGERAKPYEVLSSFAERLGSAFAQDDLLQRISSALAQGTGAETATVFIRSGDDLVPRATWPSAGKPLPSPSLEPAEADGNQGDLVTMVQHDGDVLGALAIRKRANEPVAPAERRLVEDVAAQAGLVLRNVALTEQLQAQLGELRASRQRLVVAQDQARRRLERDIHDGAQQQLIALSIKERLAHTLVGRDDEKARDLLEELQRDTTDALETLRDLAHGIYPPLLADQGLAAALESQGRKAAAPVTVRADGVGRLPQEIEAAVYFSVLEALQNIGKYADASAIDTSATRADGPRMHDGLTIFRADPSSNRP
jgi:signal transduction histidine kinase